MSNRLRAGVPIDVERRERHLVADQECLEIVEVARPTGADDANTLVGHDVGTLPPLQEVVEGGVEPLLGRFPRLEDVVVDARLVDGGDGGVGVAVGGEQGAAGVRVDVAGGLEQLDTGHLGHPLVGEDQGDPIALQMELLEPFESLAATCEIDDFVVLAVLLSHVSRYGDAHRRFVVDHHQIRSFRHAPPRPLRATPLDYPSSRG